MERTEALAVGDILKAMMESNGDTAAFDRHKICYLWSEVASAYINHHTTRRFVDGDTLHVFIDSGPLKSELAYMLPLVHRPTEQSGRQTYNKENFNTLIKCPPIHAFRLL